MNWTSIANDTFHYVATLGEFRKKFPETSWVKITTITMIAKLGIDIDVALIRKVFNTVGNITIKKKDAQFGSGLVWKLAHTTFYNQISLEYQDGYSKKSIKLFPNGSVQVAGCTDLFDCNRVIKQLQELIKLLLTKDVKSTGFQVVMINSNFSLNYNLNLHEVATHFSRNRIFDVSFDPDRYSAVKIKFKPAADMKTVTVSIFGTGKIIITGAETLKEIVFAYNIINSHIESRPSIKVEKTSTVDIYGDIIGFSMEDLLKFVEKKWKPWLFTETNYKINF